MQDLVLKLKEKIGGSVFADKYCFNVPANTSSSIVVHVEDGHTANVALYDNNDIQQRSKTVTPSNNVFPISITDVGYVLIDKRYVNGLEITAFDLSEWYVSDFFENMQILYLYNGVEGNVKDLNVNSLIQLDLERSSVNGDLVHFRDAQDLRFLRLNRTGIKGNIAVLASLANMQQLTLSGDFYGDITSLSSMIELIKLVMSGDIYGDLNTLCQSLYNNGKVSGTINIQLKNTKCTLNGNVITSNSLSAVFTSSGYTIQ